MGSTSERRALRGEDAVEDMERRAVCLMDDDDGQLL